MIVDIASSGDLNVGEKDNENVDKYQDFKSEIRNLWNLMNVEAIPVIVGALGSGSKDWTLSGANWNRHLGWIITEDSFVVKRAGILRNVLGTWEENNTEDPWP